MQVTTDSKMGRMMVEVQELMGSTDVYKLGEEQLSLEATRQTLKRYGTGSGIDVTLDSRVDASKDASTRKWESDSTNVTLALVK
jgi:hypothetical protein